jgi:hypothetical protein
MHFIAYMCRAIPLLALAFVFTYAAQAVWYRTGSIADLAFGFLLAFIYLTLIVAAWFSPSRRIVILGTVATLLVFATAEVASIASGHFSPEGPFVAAAFASICWLTTQALVNSRLAANYSLKRTAANRHGVD